MERRRASRVLWAALALSIAPPLPARAQEDFKVSPRVAALLDRHCLSCHDADAAKGDVRLDRLPALPLGDRLDLLNRVQEQLYTAEMPPRTRTSQPSEADRRELLDWAAAELKRHGASLLEAKLLKPEYGNYVDHRKLFSGEHAQLKGFTYDRRWLISEYLFDAKFNRILQVRSTATVNGRRVTALGGDRRSNVSLTNPFLLPERSGVRDYADTPLDGGHLSAMLTNAQKAAAYMTEQLAKRNPRYLPAVNEIMALEDRQQAALAARRDFLETSIATLCEELYGPDNASMLPAFVPVKLKETKALQEGETYKKAPFHVAQNMIQSLGGADAFYRAVLKHLKTARTDAQLFEACEKDWFYHGVHERTLQGRVTILRDYVEEIRDYLDGGKHKIKAPASKPLSAPEMETVRKAISAQRRKGDVYLDVVGRCMAAWEKDFEEERLRAGPPPSALLGALVDQLFTLLLERAPSEVERRDYVSLAQSYVATQGRLKAVHKLIQTLILSTEFVYRHEFGAGPADAFGRRMLSPRDASYAIAYALTDEGPDVELAKAAAEGRLSTREDYRREVVRLLQRRDTYALMDKMLAESNHPENVTNAPIRTLRFFREFFGYPAVLKIFKDEKRFGGGRLEHATRRLLNETDRLVDHILEKDRNVFEELLTTERFFVFHSGDNERMQAASDRIKGIYAYFKDLDWRNFTLDELLKHRDFLKKAAMRSVDPDKPEARNRQGDTLQLFKKSMTTITARLDKGQREAAPFDLYQGYGDDFMGGANVARFFNHRLDAWDYPTVQPAPVPHRRGLLTHPAWLIAHAQNTQTDPVIRGKWIREKLLAGTIPDVPITVDAMIPEDHGKTLRARLASVTENKNCWNCHVRMNPLGNAFESYDDFGRFRTAEALEYPEMLLKKGPDEPTYLTDSRDVYKTLPVDTTGRLEGTGDPALDGDVEDALDLAGRLAKSARVRQSIIRHAFRYFLGRNELLSDSKTLIDAEQAYLAGGGSFNAVVVSLLTSDSFIYRKALQE